MRFVQRILFCTFILISICSLSNVFALEQHKSFPSKYTIPNVPYHKQINEFCCGAASLQMALEYSGRQSSFSVTQEEIMDVARTNEDQGTMTPDVVRTGHFSLLSSAYSDIYANRPQAGFPHRRYGAATFGHYSPELWLDDLKMLILQDIPIILLTQYGLDGDTGGHFRVAVGYNDENQTLIFNDPWDREPVPIPIVSISYSNISRWWNYTEQGAPNPFFGAVILPWKLLLDITEGDDNSLVLSATWIYPCVKPFDCSKSSVNNVLLNIESLPKGVTLAKGERASRLHAGEITPPFTETIKWHLDVNQKEFDLNTPQTIKVTVQALVNGHVDAVPGKFNLLFPSYDYVDILGTEATIDIKMQ